jgi:hypothetical protein
VGGETGVVVTGGSAVGVGTSGTLADSGLQESAAKGLLAAAVLKPRAITCRINSRRETTIFLIISKAR